MNIYTTNFYAKCPVNGARIGYTLTIHTGHVVKAEDITGFVDAIGSGLHEDIADDLLARFGGSQRLTADHHGARIETIRPHVAHWGPKEPTGATHD